MALPSISQLEQLQQSFQPMSVNLLNYNGNRITGIDEELELSSDPELALQKRLIEILFNTEEEKEKYSLFDRKSEDSVSISIKALEMYARNSANLVYENGEERLEIQYERVEYLRIEESETQIQEAEPLVLDLNGNGIELTDVRKGEGVEFDITGDGQKEQVSWVSPTDGSI